MPKRIQRKRTKGWRKPEGTIIVDRTSRWGNPYKTGDIRRGYVNPITTKEAVGLYRVWVERQIRLGRLDIETLRGKDLACWCALDAPCHADVLLKLANPKSTI